MLTKAKENKAQQQQKLQLIQFTYVWCPYICRRGTRSVASCSRAPIRNIALEYTDLYYLLIYTYVNVYVYLLNLSFLAVF